MYGTVARLKVTRENVAKLREVMEQMGDRPVEGFLGSRVLIPDDFGDELILVVFFEDRETYMKNADDPRQHEDFMKMRALLDADPEWTDGEWLSMEP